MFGANGDGGGLSAAYRELPTAEARLGEALATRGMRVASSIIDAWPTLQEYLDIYARGHSTAGLLVLGGGPDAGSRHTGIPFTGAVEARDALGLAASGDARSPSGAAFWRAVATAQEAASGAPVESLFGTVHLAHARPFDCDATVPEVREASARHVLRLLSDARPQVVVTVGREALATLGLALSDARLTDFASVDERVWSERFPAGTPILRYPMADVPVARSFRARIVPVPSLDGALSDAASAQVSRLLAYAWA